MAREPSNDNVAMNSDLMMILKTIKKRSPRKAIPRVERGKSIKDPNSPFRKKVRKMETEATPPPS